MTTGTENKWRKLTPKKCTILRFLAAWRREAPPDGPEIAEAVGWCREDATPVLNSLAKDGLVRRLGKSMTYAWCWRITDAGRDALAAMGGLDEPRAEENR